MPTYYLSGIGGSQLNNTDIRALQDITDGDLAIAMDVLPVELQSPLGRYQYFLTATGCTERQDVLREEFKRRADVLRVATMEDGT